MASYQLQINERTSLGKNLVGLLQSVPHVVTLKKSKEGKEAEAKSELYESLNSAFHDVRLMIDGKKRKKTAQELLYELENEL